MEIENIADEIVDEAIELSALAAQEIIAPTENEVRLAAQDLVNEAERLMKNSTDNQKNYQDAKKGELNSVLKFSTKMVQSREDFKILMQKVLDFQNIANAFLGQKVQMTFVSITPKTGKVTLYAIENSVEDIKMDRASKSHGGNITGRYNNSMIKKLGREIINSNYDASSLESTFSEVYRRYRISKGILKLRGAAYILWKENDWDGVWISGAGPLGEAYVNFFVNEYKFSGMMETSVKTYMMDETYGAVLADNASGFLQGDVTKGALEFGVKINGATALGYVDIVNYAKELLESTNIKDFLLSLKKQLNEKGSKNMVKPLGNILETEAKALIDPLSNKT